MQAHYLLHLYRLHAGKYMLYVFICCRERTFSFDHSFWSHSSGGRGGAAAGEGGGSFSSQADVHQALGNFLLDNACRGFNCSLFAYGGCACNYASDQHILQYSYSWWRGACAPQTVGHDTVPQPSATKHIVLATKLCCSSNLLRQSPTHGKRAI